MGQCYSGGFIDDLQNNKRIIYTAVDSDTPSNSFTGIYEKTYDTFVYHLTTALWTLNADELGQPYWGNDDKLLNCSKHTIMLL